MARTQIPVHRWGPEQRFRRCFADGLDQSLLSSVAQAKPLATILTGFIQVQPHLLVHRCAPHLKFQTVSSAAASSCYN